jgi:chromosome segregation protein
LERFVEQSQFIIITHNKRTIAKADILYGVTMEERGVSKLVGMKLSGRAEPASNVTTSESRKENASQRHFTMTTNGHSEKQAGFAAR